MSTTMPSASSPARRKVASTTKVAPCRRWAGPKASPRRLWAIIMWSRTVTLNTVTPLVSDSVAERRQAPVGEPGHQVGQLAEVGPPGQQGVEGGVAQQLQRERQPLGARPGPGAGGGEGADLAGADAAPARVGGA